MLIAAIAIAVLFVGCLAFCFLWLHAEIDYAESEQRNRELARKLERRRALSTPSPVPTSRGTLPHDPKNKEAA